jgi:SAM-dependent methyltransferase
MVQHAQQRLRGRRSFRFSNLDAQTIPFQSSCFDAVIANHMLYHVPDRAKALAEIRRVLKPGGRLYASTNGERQMQEIGDLCGRFDPQLPWSLQFSGPFTLENGAAQLQPWFPAVSLRCYPDSLLVTQAEPLVAYILSGRVKLPPDRQQELARFVEQELQARGGTFYITKDSGIFIYIP